MKNRHFRTTLLLAVLLSSCDCYYEVSGVVLDKNTLQPIGSVVVSKTDDIDSNSTMLGKTLSEEDGVFEMSGISGFCRKIDMFFVKEGYETLKFSLTNNSKDTVLLQRIRR